MNQLFENYCAIPAGRYCTGADIENFCGADIENIYCAIPGSQCSSGADIDKYCGANIDSIVQYQAFRYCSGGADIDWSLEIVLAEIACNSQPECYEYVSMSLDCRTDQLYKCTCYRVAPSKLY